MLLARRLPFQRLRPVCASFRPVRTSFRPFCASATTGDKPGVAGETKGATTEKLGTTEEKAGATEEKAGSSEEKSGTTDSEPGEGDIVESDGRKPIFACDGIEVALSDARKLQFAGILYIGLGTVTAIGGTAAILHPAASALLAFWGMGYAAMAKMTSDRLVLAVRNKYVVRVELETDANIPDGIEATQHALATTDIWRVKIGLESMPKHMVAVELRERSSLDEDDPARLRPAFSRVLKGATHFNRENATYCDEKALDLLLNSDKVVTAEAVVPIVPEHPAVKRARQMVALKEQERKQELKTKNFGFHKEEETAPAVVQPKPVPREEAPPSETQNYFIDITSAHLDIADALRKDKEDHITSLSRIGFKTEFYGKFCLAMGIGVAFMPQIVAAIVGSVEF